GVELAQKTRRAERLEVVLHKQEEVGACAELITCIVSNIWDFEKLQGSVSVQAAATAEASVELHINETVGEIMQMLRKSSLYKPSVALRTVCDDMIPAKLWGQRSILVRALLNLISNSLKFTDGGHVTERDRRACEGRGECHCWPLMATDGHGVWPRIASDDV
ncbi:MAG: hypothetical protein EB084_25145, partial [Proteobacteria bacterium]|nr:hypothetical protein [Pseudomonadota bacterium]